MGEAAVQKSWFFPKANMDTCSTDKQSDKSPARCGHRKLYSLEHPLAHKPHKRVLPSLVFLDCCTKIHSRIGVFPAQQGGLHGTNDSVLPSKRRVKRCHVRRSLEEFVCVSNCVRPHLDAKGGHNSQCPYLQAIVLHHIADRDEEMKSQPQALIASSASCRCYSE